MIRAIPYTTLWPGLVIWSLLTAGFLLATAWMLREDYRFAYDSQPAVATIERKYHHISHGRHGTTYTPCLAYSYEVDGMMADCESSVQEETYSIVSTGGTMPVLYVKDAWTDNRIDLPAENRHVRLINFGLIAVCLIVTLGGAAILFWYRRQNELNQYLLASGAPCTGTVSEVSFDILGKAHTRRYYLVFSFRDDAGREMSGKSWYLKPGDESLWKPGCAIRVHYDPRNSERFTIDLNTDPSRS